MIYRCVCAVDVYGCLESSGTRCPSRCPRVHERRSGVVRFATAGAGHESDWDLGRAGSASATPPRMASASARGASPPCPPAREPASWPAGHPARQAERGRPRGRLADLLSRGLPGFRAGLPGCQAASQAYPLDVSIRHSAFGPASQPASQPASSR